MITETKNLKFVEQKKAFIETWERESEGFTVKWWGSFSVVFENEFLLLLQTFGAGRQISRS